MVASSPSRRDKVNESPLKIALFALVKMSNNESCRQFLKSSDQLPALGRLRQSVDPVIAKYVSYIIDKMAEN